MKTKLPQKILASFALLTFFSLIGCSEDAKEAIQNVAEAPTLQGEFTSRCGSSMLLDASERTVYKFEGNEVTRSQIFYSEDNCVNETGRIEYVGDFTAEENYEDSATVGGNLDIEITEAKIIPKSDGLAKALNAINFCGVDNFAKDKEVELTGMQTRGLCPIDNIPTKRYTTYRTDDINLYLADTEFGSMAKVAVDRNDDVQYRPYYTDKEAVAAIEKEERLKAEAEETANKVEAEAEKAAQNVEEEVNEAAQNVEREANEAADRVETEVDEAAQNVEEEVDEVQRDTRDMADRAEAEVEETANEVEAEIDAATDDE